MSQNNYNNIILALLKEENHIRGLAKQLRTSQTTVARMAKQMQAENVIDFRQEGRNKVLFLKKTLEAKQKAYAAEAQKLLDLLKRYPVLRRIIEEIRKDERIQLAVLFGSYARAAAAKNSDIDIYIDTQDSRIKEKIELIDSRISAKIGKYNKDSPLIREIEKNHAIIKGVEAYYEKCGLFD